MPPNSLKKEKIKIKKLKPNATNEEVIEKVDQVVDVLDRLGIEFMSVEGNDRTVNFNPGKSRIELSDERLAAMGHTRRTRPNTQ